jgi:outer membrane protein OmpA-like peptidoglycan-associated protein
MGIRFQKNLLIIFLGLLSTILSSQNLINNGDFENLIRCPTALAQFEFATGWINPTRGTPDLFCSCKKAKKHIGVPKNYDGYQNAKSGNCYAGFIAYDATNRNYSEYLHAKLSTPLEKGKNYCLSLHYSLADYAGYHVNKLGVLFADKRLLRKKNGERLQFVPQLTSSLKIDTLNWTTVCLNYIATGEEKYITIGAFQYDSIISLAKYYGKSRNKNIMLSAYAYYYIDDVSLVKLKEGDLCNCRSEIKSNDAELVQITDEVSLYDSAVGKPLVLKNIIFENNKAILQASSYEELDKLVVYLKQNDTYKIELSGHTDNVGKEQNNLMLSEARAEAVANYLQQKGITSGRIKYKGYGSSKPLNENLTDEGRLKNRRVEIILTK